MVLILQLKIPTTIMCISVTMKKYNFNFRLYDVLSIILHVLILITLFCIIIFIIIEYNIDTTA